MTLAAFLLLSSALLNTEARPVYVDVSIGAHGPYRFLLDTGAQTNLIDATLAEELRLEPQFRVEIVTQNSSRLWPGLRIPICERGRQRCRKSSWFSTIWLMRGARIHRSADCWG